MKQKAKMKNKKLNQLFKWIFNSSETIFLGFGIIRIFISIDTAKGF